MNRYAVAATVLCICAAYVLVSALTELTSAPVAAQTEEDYAAATSLAPLAVANDMALKSGKSKYQYKTDSLSDADQGWAIAAECPTAYSSFDQISTVRMRGRQSGKADSFDHQFRLKPSGVAGNGMSYKGRFFPWDSSVAHGRTSSGSDHKFACGMFKAKLVPDKATGQYRMRFLYAVTSASGMGEMGETARFREMKDYMAGAKKTNGVVNAEYAMTLNSLEQHDVAGQTSFKAGQKNATGKALKPPAAAR